MNISLNRLHFFRISIVFFALTGGICQRLNAQNIKGEFHNFIIVNGPTPSITFDIYLSASPTYIADVTANGVNKGLQNVDLAFEVDFGTDGSAATGTNAPIVAPSYSSFSIQANTNSITASNVSGAMAAGYDSRFKLNLDRLTSNAQITATPTKAGSLKVNYPAGTVIGSDANGATFKLRVTNSATGSRWSDFLFNTGQSVGSSATYVGYAANTQPLNSPGVVLPVRLVYFNASCNRNDKTTLLKWQSAGEYMSDYYEVERAADATRFDAIISHTTAAGNTGLPITYTAYDTHPLEGDNYYRLKMMDINGHYTYSPLQKVHFQYPKEKAVSISPNPVSSSTYLKITSETDQSVNYIISDLNGKEIIKGLIKAQKGTREYPLPNIFTLAPGNYYLHAKAVSLNNTVIFTKIK